MSATGEKVAARVTEALTAILAKAHIGGYRFTLKEAKLVEKSMYETEAAHGQESRTHFKIKFDPQKIEKRTDEQIVSDVFHELMHAMLWRFTNDILDEVQPYVPPDRYKQLSDKLHKFEEEFVYSVESIGLALMDKPDPVITVETT